MTRRTVSHPRSAPRSPAAGVEAFDVNLETQKVTVKGNVTLEAVMDKIAKTGKEVSVWMD